MDVVTDPLRDMLTVILEYLPRIFWAAVVLLAAWIIAKVLRSLVRRGLRSAKVDERMSRWVGRKEEEPPFRIAEGTGRVVYWLILLLSVPAILGILNLGGLIQPFQNMVETILAALPAIFAAILIVVVAYFVGRAVAAVVTSLLTRAGFDNVLVRLGLTTRPAAGPWTPSRVVGYLALLAILLFAIIAVAELLNFAVVADLASDFTAFAGRVILGLIIFGLALFLASIAAKAMEATGRPQSSLFALVARVSILLLGGAIALRTMGFANDLITLGFGLLVGAIAVAVAIAFGIGGRESAARQLEEWRKSLKREE